MSRSITEIDWVGIIVDVIFASPVLVKTIKTKPFVTTILQALKVYVGIRSRKKWQSYISFKGCRHHLGLFSSAIMAARAYNTAAKKFFGEFAFLNLVKNFN